MIHELKGNRSNSKKSIQKGAKKIQDRFDFVQCPKMPTQSVFYQSTFGNHQPKHHPVSPSTSLLYQKQNIDNRYLYSSKSHGNISPRKFYQPSMTTDSLLRKVKILEGRIQQLHNEKQIMARNFHIEKEAWIKENKTLEGLIQRERLINGSKIDHLANSLEEWRASVENKKIVADQEPRNKCMTESKQNKKEQKTENSSEMNPFSILMKNRDKFMNQFAIDDPLSHQTQTHQFQNQQPQFQQDPTQYSIQHPMMQYNPISSFMQQRFFKLGFANSGISSDSQNTETVQQESVADQVQELNKKIVEQCMMGSS